VASDSGHTYPHAARSDARIMRVAVPTETSVTVGATLGTPRTPRTPRRAAMAAVLVAALRCSGYFGLGESEIAPTDRGNKGVFADAQDAFRQCVQVRASDTDNKPC